MNSNMRVRMMDMGELIRMNPEQNKSHEKLIYRVIIIYIRREAFCATSITSGGKAPLELCCAFTFHKYLTWKRSIAKNDAISPD